MAMIGAQFVQAVQPVPVGSLQAFAGANAPTGWLLCDGTSYSTSVYPDLFSVLGYTYGGSGANFNVPDLRGRMPIGAGNDGTAANNATRTRGDKGGDTRMQSHSHFYPWNNAGNGAGGIGVVRLDANVGNTASSTTGSGSGENMPPFLVTNYIIKALPDVPRQGVALGNTPPIVTTLPANPQFGEVVTYVADATNGVYWTLQYDGGGTYPWKFVGGAPLTASAVGTYSSPATGSTSNYVNSGLSGSPSIAAPLAGDYITRVNANAKTSNASAAPGVFISYASAAPGSWDGSDALAGGGAATSYVLGAQKRGTVTLANQSIALVWTNANIGGSASFYSVYMSATPIRVKAA